MKFCHSASFRFETIAVVSVKQMLTNERVAAGQSHLLCYYWAAEL